MRAPISVIIPTLNAEADLPGCLESLAEGLSAGLIRELIVTDGSSTDATGAIAEAAGAVLVTGQAGRGEQLARGARIAEGAWLLFLHADTNLQPGWAAAVMAHLVDAPERAGYFRFSFRTPGAMARFVAGWANLRARLFGLPYGDQGLLIPSNLYAAVGGYDDIPLMEDVALVRRLRGRLRRLDAVAATGAERYLAGGWLKRGARNLWTLLRYLFGADPAKLARSYRKR